MVANSRLADEQALGDLVVRQAIADEHDDFNLSTGEREKAAAGHVSVLVSVGGASEVAERGYQHSRQPELTSLHFLDGGDERVEWRVLAHEPLHAGTDGGAL